jgi:tRNA nucleotidyltransferase (CCA-adding enzyme)
VARPLPSAPPAVRWIARTLEEAGHETWAVGGAVRDVLMGRPSGDWDLATHATPKEVRRLFKRTVPIGVEHGTIGVLARDGTMYEVTTFRRDVETDGRHAIVSFAETIQEDLARRDFTVNAIAWHPLREELLDPFDGVGDLDRSVLRTVGEPAERFREDYLRILRALRFAGLFTLEIEEPTWEALCSLVGHLKTLSAERIREELLKILNADPDPTRSLSLYGSSRVLAVLYPDRCFGWRSCCGSSTRGTPRGCCCGCGCRMPRSTRRHRGSRPTPSPRPTRRSVCSVTG